MRKLLCIDLVSLYPGAHTTPWSTLLSPFLSHQLESSLNDQAFPAQPPISWDPSNISWHPLLNNFNLDPANDNCAGRPHFVLMLINNSGADGLGAIRPAQRRSLCVRATVPSLLSQLRSSLAPRLHTFLDSWLSIIASLCLIIYTDLCTHPAVNEIDAVVYVLPCFPFLSEFWRDAARLLNSLIRGTHAAAQQHGSMPHPSSISLLYRNESLTRP